MMSLLSKTTDVIFYSYNVDRPARVIVGIEVAYTAIRGLSEWFGSWNLRNYESVHSISSVLQKGFLAVYDGFSFCYSMCSSCGSVRRQPCLLEMRKNISGGFVTAALGTCHIAFNILDNIFYYCGYKPKSDHVQALVWPYVATVMCIVGVHMYLAYRYVYGNKRLLSMKVAEDESELLLCDIEEGQLDRDKAQLAFSLTNMVNELILGVMTKSPIYAVAALVHSYVFFKEKSSKWLIFRVKFPSRYGFPKMKANYKFLALSTRAVAEDRCAICLEDDPDTHFCRTHCYHQACLIEMIASKMSNVLSRLRIDSRQVSGVRWSESNREEYWVDYQVTLPTENLPSCPLCRTMPPFNALHIDITDPVHGSKTATTINWV